ncbi:tudor domain-containing protein 7 [Nephila pilipes]|uniref:Tudor domain-containing protein 7 n=1 Tax=Nephila pilipes TaxID=299642 RepID=A0A8X6QT24_NEPPI|nr:tudor domain-containing protein 7 [Nephila pilipes]
MHQLRFHFYSYLSPVSTVRLSLYDRYCVKMDKQDLKETVLLNLRSVTQSCKGGVPLTRLERDYRDLLGTRIPFKELGYNTLEGFIRDIPDVICLKKNWEGQLMAEGVADASTAHIASLVSRQKQSKPPSRGNRKPYLSRRGGSSTRHRSRGSRGSFVSSSNTPFQPSGRSYKQDRVSKASHSKSPTLPSRVNNSKAIAQSSFSKSNASANVPSRKYEMAPRFMKANQRKMEENNQTSPTRTSFSTSPPAQFSSSDISSVSPPRIVSSATAYLEPQDVYNGNRWQRSPRPLLSRSNLGRIDRFKQQLDAAATSKEFVDIYAKTKNIPVKYITSLMGQKKKGFVSSLKLGEKVYRSYPHVARSEEEAEEIAAQAAVESIQESKEFLATLPETPIRNAEEIQILLNRIEEIVYDKPSGMFANGIMAEYEHKFNELLPENWLDILQTSSNLDMDPIAVPFGKVPDGINFIVRPSKLFSSGSTTPSEASNKMNSEQLELEGEDFSSKNTFNHTHPPVPKLVIPDGNEWSVFITNTVNFVTARLIDFDDEFLNMSKRMTAFYDSQSLPVQEIYEKQLYAVVGDRIDGELVMHRVLANKILDNDMIQGYYVDEGVFIGMKKSDLQELSEEFLTVPYQAIHLTLDGCEDYEPFITQEHLEPLLYRTFIAVVKRCCSHMEDILPEDPGIHRVIYSVSLYDTSDSENDICINDNLKETVIESLVCKLPKMGVSSRGYLTHVTENGEIFLRFHHPENSFLEIELEKYSSIFEEACLENTALITGKVYAAKFQDGKWYRAVISTNINVPAPEMVEVIFIDYGHPSLVRKSEICEMEPHSEFLSTLGSQAIMCELSNALPSPDMKWSISATNKLLELAPFNEELIVRVITEGNIHSLAKVSLHKRIYTKEDSFIISVNENLASRLELFKDMSASESVASPKIPTQLNLQYNPTSHVSKGSLSSFSSKVTTPNDESMINSVKKMNIASPSNDGIEWLMTPDNVKSPDAYEDESPLPLSPPDVPGEGKEFGVFVTMAANPHNFVVQPLSSASEMNKLMNQMQQFYSVEENLIEMHPSLLKKNGFYAALHSDNVWYRIRLVSFLNSDPCEAAVYYVDFGDFNYVPLNKIQKLWNQFRNLPCQAIKASLSGVKPTEADWKPEHCVQFLKMVTEKTFFSLVQKKKLIEESDFSFIELELTLIDTSIPDKDVYIHELLIEKSMACPVEK